MKWIALLTLYFCSNTFACNETASKYLKLANDLALELPEVYAQTEKNKKYSDEYWIRSPQLVNEGGYRYLKHDIAISYAWNGCYKEALNVASSIENLGVKDSAWAQIAIEFAKHDDFEESMKLIKAIKYPSGGEIARTHVSKEMVRAGKVEEARKVLRSAGLKDNHYLSYFYQNALNLANAGKHTEAIEYVNRRPIENQHVHNAFGDMILLFQSKADIESAKRILSFYKNKNISNEPSVAFAKYFARQGNFQTAKLYLKKIKRDELKVSTAFEIISHSKNSNDDLYNYALKIIDKHFSTKSDWTIVSHSAYDIYKLKGQQVAETFINKYFDVTDNKSKFIYNSIFKGLYEDKKFRELLDFINSSKGNTGKSAFHETIAKLHLHKITTLPNRVTLGNRTHSFNELIKAAMKANHEPKMILESTLKNYPIYPEPRPYRRSNVLQMIAMYSADKLGMEKADELLSKKEVNNLDLTRWYIGLSMMNRAKELVNSTLFYVHIPA